MLVPIRAAYRGYGELNDDECSEVFDRWRQSLEGLPHWLEVRNAGDVVCIAYREPLNARLFRIIPAVGFTGLGIYFVDADYKRARQYALMLCVEGMDASCV